MIKPKKIVDVQFHEGKVIGKTVSLDYSTPESRQRLEEYHKELSKPPVERKLPLLGLDTLKQLLWQRMKENALSVDDNNKVFFKTLLYYFSEDERFLKSKLITNKPDLKKGLFIIGSFGFGKSITMEMLKQCLTNTKKSFAYDSTISIFNKIESKEIEIERYSKGTWCFDDLGQEEKSFGKELFSGILFQRYSAFKNSKKLTHITSNMTLEEVQSRYGQYISSRFNEMFNVIEVSGEDRRK